MKGDGKQKWKWVQGKQELSHKRITFLAVNADKNEMKGSEAVPTLE